MHPKITLRSFKIRPRELFSSEGRVMRRAQYLVVCLGLFVILISVSRIEQATRPRGHLTCRTECTHTVRNNDNGPRPGRKPAARTDNAALVHSVFWASSFLAFTSFDT